LHVTCAHDGYRRLPGRPVHWRRWVLQPGSLTIADRVEGRFGSAVARYHVHPDVDCELEETGQAGMFRSPSGQQVRWQVEGGGGVATLQASIYCSEFGLRQPTRCIELAFEGETEIKLNLTW
jgi:uncharacterized heparinase superfamily protein